MAPAGGGRRRRGQEEGREGGGLGGVVLVASLVVEMMDVGGVEVVGVVDWVVREGREDEGGGRGI